MSDYVYPCGETSISDSFADHVNRNSVNPGVDYEAPTGSAIYSVSDGVVADADGSPSGGGGRTIHINHDDGTGADYLHLNALSVSTGDRVTKGQKIGYSGGSGNGSNTYYGPHLHISFRPNHSGGYGNNGNQDFQAIMDSQNTSIAGGDTESLVGKDDVKVNFYKTTDGTLWYGAYAISTTEVYDVLVRYDASNPNARDEFNPQQKDWILAALKANGVHS
jgi:murein DD-endopeptidase MepM/ murein hydrolase activator NlpD